MRTLFRFLFIIFLILGIIGVAWSGWWWHKSTPSFTGVKEKICEPRPKIEVYFSPKGGTDAAIINLINQSKKRLWMAVYSFTNKDIFESIKMAEKRGIDVRVIQDKSQSKGKKALVYPKAKIISGTGGGIMHHKFIIMDDICIELGSYNYTMNAELRNDENALIICGDNKLIKKYEEEFERMWWK